jgi:hypothetical protein
MRSDHGTPSRPTATPQAPAYVTQIICRRVRPERQADYERWLKERLMPALAGFDGYEGATVLRPGETPTKEYVIIQRWRDYAALQGWVDSDLRGAVLGESEPLSVSAPSRRRETGLEVWFQLPGRGAVRPPPRYKMALVIWMVIAPLSLAANALLGAPLAGLPDVAATYVKAGVIVLIMTYLAMPLARRLLARWLDA